MTYVQLIAYFKTQEAAAAALGLKQPSISDWKENGIPLPRQAQYQILTRGKLKAELPVERAA